MRLGHFVRAGSASAAFAVALFLAAPASAQHEHHGAPPPPPPADGPAAWNASPAPGIAHGLDPRARADWIDECSRRIAERDNSAYYGWKRERRQAEDRARADCTRYLDDYYAYYARAGQGSGAMQYGHGCCQAQPMMMMPAPRRAAPQCTETVEEIIEEMPVARRVIRQRVRVAPDKRVRY